MAATPDSRNTGATANWMACATAVMPVSCCINGMGRADSLGPRAHDDRYHQHLHEPVTGMDGGHFPRDVLPEDRSREKDHREADPHAEAEVHRAHPPADAE